MTYLAAAIQLAAGSDKAANLERAERLIRLAAARGANLVGLPETFNWRGKRSEEAAAAEPLEGESLAVISRLARELSLYIVAGSITEHAPGQPKRYNTSALIGPPVRAAFNAMAPSSSGSNSRISIPPTRMAPFCTS